MRSEIVLIHGFLGAPSSWDAVVEAWPRAWSARKLAVLGHGLNPLEGEESVDSFEDEVSRLLLRCGGGATHRTLVGYSLGARLALGMAARAERPFGRLVLVSGRDGLDDVDEARARAAHDDALAQVLVRDGLQRFVDRWETLPLFETQRTLPEARRAEHRARRLSHEACRLARALRILSLGRMPKYADDAFARTPRVTVVVGEHDPKFRRIADDWAHRYRVAVRVVAGAGHDVVLERPEALAAIIVEPSSPAELAP